MVRDLTEGYLAITERTFHRMQPPELRQLSFELERRLREVRGHQPPLEETQELQLRQRRLQRLIGAQRMLQAYVAKRRG